MTDLSTIKAALAAATEGPWHQGPHYKTDVESPRGRVAEVGHLGTPQGISDAALIVLLRNLAPDLIAEVERLRALIAEAETVLGVDEHGTLTTEELAAIKAALAEGQISTLSWNQIAALVEEVERKRGLEKDIDRLADAIAPFRHTVEDRELWEHEDGSLNIGALAAAACDTRLDRQPYPTAAAYEAVCAARTNWQERAAQAEAARKEAERQLAECRETLAKVDACAAEALSRISGSYWGKVVAELETIVEIVEAALAGKGE